MLTTAKEKTKDKELKSQEKVQQSSNIYNQPVNTNKRPSTSQSTSISTSNRFSTSGLYQKPKKNFFSSSISSATEAPAKISQHPILSDLLQPKLPPPAGVQTQV